MKLLFLFVIYFNLSNSLKLKQDPIQICLQENSLIYLECGLLTTCSKCSANIKCGWCKSSNSCIPIILRNNNIEELCNNNCEEIAPLSDCLYDVLKSNSIGNNLQNILLNEEDSKVLKEAKFNEFKNALKENTKINIIGGGESNHFFGKNLIDISQKVFNEELDKIKMSDLENLSNLIVKRDKSINNNKNDLSPLESKLSELKKEKIKLISNDYEFKH